MVPRCLQPLDSGNMDFSKLMKMVAYRFNGVDPIEPNPAFSDAVRKIVASGKGVITMCEAGG